MSKRKPYPPYSIDNTTFSTSEPIAIDWLTIEYREEFNSEEDSHNKS